MTSVVVWCWCCSGENLSQVNCSYINADNTVSRRVFCSRECLRCPHKPAGSQPAPKNWSLLALDSHESLKSVKWWTADSMQMALRASVGLLPRNGFLSRFWAKTRDREHETCLFQSSGRTAHAVAERAAMLVRLYTYTGMLSGYPLF
jgi:hypothetical protein